MRLALAILAVALCGVAAPTAVVLSTGQQPPPSAAVVFAPTNQTGYYPQVWLVGDDTGPSSNAIASWADRSTNAFSFVQATAAAKPANRTNALNGHTYVAFDGTDDAMLATMTLNQAWQVTQVIQITNKALTGFWGSANNAASRLNAGFIGMAGSGLVVSSSLTNKFLVLTFAGLNTSSLVYTNDKQAWTGTEASAIAGLGLAYNNFANNTFGNVNIAEMLVYTNALPITNVTAFSNLFNYLTNKYALTPLP